MTYDPGNPLYSVNSLIDRITERLTAQSLTPADIESMSAWIARRRIVLEGFPLDLDARPWLTDIYNDATPHVVLRKATQVGGSVWAILSVLHKCDVVKDWRGTVYFFPTKTDVLDFSQTRVQPMIEENPTLQELMGHVDKVGVRQVGDAFVYFRGMKSKIGMKSVPADQVVFDELDEATENAKAMARERLAASKYKYQLELSNPSLPGYGIDLAFGGNPETGQFGSDERYWHIRCRGCRTWTVMELEFPREIGQENLRCFRPAKKFIGTWKRALLDGTPIEDMGWYRACAKCGKPINPIDGQWVALRPKITSPHGYSLSQLFSPTVTATEIVKRYATTRHPQHFYNLNVGIGWLPSTDRLTVGHVLRWCTDAGLLERSDTPCTMGFDQGADLHVVVSRPGPIANTRQIIHLGIYKDFEELDDIMRRFHVQRCVGDALPETRPARAFALRHRGKVYLNFYNEMQRGRPAWNEDNLTVLENRTESLDASRAPFHLDPMNAATETNTVRVLLPRAFDLVQDFARHMAALMKKREEEDDETVQKSGRRTIRTGGVRYVYVRSAPDHFAHAWNYDFLCWGTDMSSVSRPGTGLATAAVGTGIIVDNRITNPEHPLYGSKRRLRIRQPGSRF